MENPENTGCCPIVLIPGFMLDETLWDEFREELPDGWPVYGGTLAGGSTIREITRHIAQHAPARFVLVGFSLGGYVARQLAADFPEKVAALAVVASSLREDTDQQLRVKRQAVQAMSAATFKGLSNAAIAHSLHPARAANAELIARIKRMGNRLGYEALAIQSSLDRGGVPTASIACPTLVVAASDDAMRSRREAEELVEAIPGASLRVIEDSGHMIPLEQPRALAATLIQWLDSLDIH